MGQVVDVAGALADCFLYIEGAVPKGTPVPGESMDSVHKDEVQVISYDLGVSGESGVTGNETDSDSKSESKQWKANFYPVAIRIGVSRASPFLAKAAWTGEVFKAMTISVRKPGASPGDGDYLQWRFTTVQVTSYTQELSSQKPTESISISYQQIEMYYASQGSHGALQNKENRAYTMDGNKVVSVYTLPYKPKPAAASAPGSA